MVTSGDCLKVFGDPSTKFDEGTYMVLWKVPEYIWKAIPEIPRKIYCNKQMLVPLETAFYNIIDRGLTDQMKTWDGCFNIRRKRGRNSWSLHSWGIAIDINAAWNRLGQEPKMNRDLVKCFLDAGFDWGGYWVNRPDGMHFQLSYINELD